MEQCVEAFDKETGAYTFWCQMDQMGGWFGDFLNGATPAFPFLFVIMIKAFVVIVFFAAKAAVSG